MGVNIEITNVNKDTDVISYTQDGESKTAEVVLPAQIKWAKNGKAEAGFNNEGKINFVKSLEPKQAGGYSGGYVKPESKFRAVSTMQVLENVSLTEIKAVYDSINAAEHKKCGASTLFRRDDGTYDAALYVTDFVLKDTSAQEM